MEGTRFRPYIKSTNINVGFQPLGEDLFKLIRSPGIGLVPNNTSAVVDSRG
jgi:hypothetical protein